MHDFCVLSEKKVYNSRKGFSHAFDYQAASYGISDACLAALGVAPAARCGATALTDRSVRDPSPQVVQWIVDI